LFGALAVFSFFPAVFLLLFRKIKRHVAPFTTNRGIVFLAPRRECLLGW